MKRLFILVLATVLSFSCRDSFDPTEYVVTTMGSGAEGGIVPVVSVPFGMVQLAPDTLPGINGYWYGHNSIHGFSHTHKSGCGGGSDWQDILFTPVSGDLWSSVHTLDFFRTTPFSHDDEHTVPGYYSVYLPEDGVKAELTATKRCGLHRYTYPADSTENLIINLKFGNPTNCFICCLLDFRTLRTSGREIPSRS